jgi:hypothetical protein
VDLERVLIAVGRGSTYDTRRIVISHLISAERSVVEDLEKRSEDMCLARIDEPEFHDSTRTPVRDGDEIIDWNQQFAVEIQKDF